MDQPNCRSVQKTFVISITFKSRIHVFPRDAPRPPVALMAAEGGATHVAIIDSGASDFIFHIDRSHFDNYRVVATTIKTADGKMKAL